MYTIEDVENVLKKFKNESGFDLFDLINDMEIYKEYMKRITINQEEYDKANDLLNETMTILCDFHDKYNNI